MLDACAAPGGKLFHLLESRPDVNATAVEKSPTRMARLRAEAARLGHAPDTILADATHLDWWDGTPFDSVLVDAPCSGSGTLRRHPDIKILRNAADLVGYAQLQLALMTNLWHTLRPGGSLLYCTCSLFTEENDAVVADFLEATGNARVERIELPTGMPRKSGWQLLPTDTRTDGFYFSLISKAPLPRKEPLPDKDLTRLPT
jgi:16S rRNA (cytosine967-C5)-methyltransferase